MKISVIFLLLILPAFCLYSQESFLLQSAGTITTGELKEHVYVLSSDPFGGRYTGSEGQRMAAEYIQEEFREDGLKVPYPGSSMPYFQDFTLEKCYWKDQSLAIGDMKYTFGEDFIIMGEPENIQGTYPVIFAGYGLDDSAYSNYHGLDVTGKVVMAFSGEPKGKDGNYIISGRSEPSRQAYYYSKRRIAQAKGAVGLVILAREEKGFNKFAKHSEDMLAQPNISYPSEEKENNIFTIYTDLEIGAAILDITVNTLAEMAREESAAAFPTDLHGNITINASSECYPMHTENVIGIVEGTDKKDEAVVVVAHYDHVGKQEGKLYPGADDNASGTAAVMEVAEAFAQSALDGNRPRRTVVFLAVSAEEIGLYGSKYYSEHPIIPLEKTFACVNIDMIGRVGSKYKDEPMYVGGSAYISKDIFTVARQYNSLMAPGLKDIMEFSPQVRGGSDHYYFAEAGIPSLFYFTGIHKDYHSPADTPDKVLYERMEMIVKAIFGTAWHLANTEEGLKIED